MALLRGHLDLDPHDFISELKLSELLAKHRNMDELGERAGRDTFAAAEFAGALADQGRLRDALAVLRPRADAGDLWAAQRLCDLLVRHAQIDELRAEIAAGTPGAVEAMQVLADSRDAEQARRL
jgi:hypothetical protein